MERSIRPTVCFSSDGSLLAVSGSGGDVCVWESQSGKQLCRPACANWSSVFCLAWAPLKVQITIQYFFCYNYLYNVAIIFGIKGKERHL